MLEFLGRIEQTNRLFNRFEEKTAYGRRSSTIDFQQEKYAKGAAGYDDRIRNPFPFYETIHTATNAILRGILGAQSELLIVGAGSGAEILKLGNPTRVGVF